MLYYKDFETKKTNTANKVACQFKEQVDRVLWLG